MAAVFHISMKQLFISCPDSLLAAKELFFAGKEFRDLLQRKKVQMGIGMPLEEKRIAMYYPRIADKILALKLRAFGATNIVGPKRSGKTEMALLLFAPRLLNILRLFSTKTSSLFPFAGFLWFL